MPESRALAETISLPTSHFVIGLLVGHTYLYAKGVIAPQRRPSPTVLTQSLRPSLAEGVF
jgi:hypothetical protein